MNPETNKFEKLFAMEGEPNEEQSELLKKMTTKEGVPPMPGNLFRPNGEPVPKHWSVFSAGELVVLKNYTFKVGYIGEGCLVLEPFGPAQVKKKRSVVLSKKKKRRR